MSLFPGPCAHLVFSITHKVKQTKFITYFSILHAGGLSLFRFLNGLHSRSISPIGPANQSRVWGYNIFTVSHLVRAVMINCRFSLPCLTKTTENVSIFVYVCTLHFALCANLLLLIKVITGAYIYRYLWRSLINHVIHTERLVICCPNLYEKAPRTYNTLMYQLGHSTEDTYQSPDF